MTFSKDNKEGLVQMNNEDFDFNLQFEQLFLSAIPSALFIVISLWRTVLQLRKPTIVQATHFKFIKSSAIAICFCLELALLVLVALPSINVTRIFLASAALKVVSAFLMLVLSVVDHSKSPRPSVWLCIYLFFSILFDAVQLRTLFLSADDGPEHTYSSVASAELAVKVTILFLEAQGKTRWLAWNEKEHSPEETAGVFSLSVFSWLNRLLLVGYRKILAIRDLFPLDIALSAPSLQGRFAKNLKRARIKGYELGKFGLLRVLVLTLWRPLLMPIPPRLALLGFTFCQPFFLHKLLEHLSQAEVEVNVGYGFIGASVLIYGGMAISTALYWYFQLRMLTMTRTLLVIETFTKATEARVGVRDNNAALTLMSTDIERITVGFRAFHDFWASSIQVALASWMLYEELGVAFAAPLVVVIISIATLAMLLSLTGDSQRAWMAGVQKRVGLTATAIAKMKALKTSGLSVAVGDLVQKLRVEELAKGNRFRKIETCAAVIAFTPMMVGPVLTFAFAQRTLDTARIYTSLSYLLLLTNPLSMIFQLLPGFISGLACLGRIQSYLECENRHDPRLAIADLRQDLSAAEKESAETPHITITDGKFGWADDNVVLCDINLSIPKSSLTIVVGPVASGKSTLCKALLGELPVSDGKILMNTHPIRVGFCDQTPFLTNKSIRDCIVGYSPVDAMRYTEVVEATCLDQDFDTSAFEMPMGSDGFTLSGGQKQRVALARALYLQTDLLVLDDVFSGLDADTEEQVFRNVFGSNGLLKKRRSTVVLCTHSVNHLPMADYIVALGDGTIVQQGPWDDLIAREGYVQDLAIRVGSDDDASSSEKAAAGAKKDDSDPKKPELNEGNPMASLVHPPDDLSRQIGDRTVYMYYFKNMGYLLASFTVFSGMCVGFLMSFPTLWLKYWAADTMSENPSHTFAFYLGIFSLLQVQAMIWLGFLALSLYIVSVPLVGAKLHHLALRTLLRAPLRFFTETDTGVVLNLLSQDLNLLDTELPDALLNTLYAVFTAIGQAAVMLTSSPYLGISYPFLIALMWIVQRFYLRTSRQLRLLDLELKSPLYTHFFDTLKGAITLRAFGFISDDIKKVGHLVDTSQRPAYFLYMIQQWLTLVLDTVVMVLAVIITTLAVRLHTNSGFTGASLVTLMSFGKILSGVVMFYTKLETSIGAIARLKAFNDTVMPEDRGYENTIPVKDWPQRGVIQLKNVSASYNADNQSENAAVLALQNITLNIASGEKLAVCGRTGSGKSSMIALLLKLLDPLPGDAAEIMIDDIPLGQIDRSNLRQRIIAIPQDAVFLPEGSSFKENLDAFHEATSTQCKEVLEVIEAWPLVEQKGGLDAEMGADSLSQGQKQLFSLGRAVLKRRIRAAQDPSQDGGILLLDEVSSSVDSNTERLMQGVIAMEFKSYTVVAISHRLEMIMDFDTVVVMDTGKIIEVGNPRMLASRGTATRFGELLRAGNVQE